MKIKYTLPLLLMLSPTTTLAEVGDIHSVKVDNGIVREGAGKNSPLVEKLAKGSEIMEMDIQGEWYEIYVASSDLSGWMHVSTLTLLGSGTAPAPAATQKKVAKTTPKPELKLKSSGTQSAGMKKFNKYLVKYNARTHALKGYTPFTQAKEINGDLQITVTSIWMEKSTARQKSSLITLRARWKKITGNSDARIMAVDTSGNKVMDYPR